MFKRVLIAEDQECANISVKKTLEDLGIEKPDYVFYCDDALTRVKKGLQLDQPYDLLITDLSFEEDCPQTINDGRALIAAAKEIQPLLKVLVFSAENKIAIIDALFKDLGIDGYVRKARHDAQELKEAIGAIYNNKKHLAHNLRQTIKKERNSHDFTPFDLTIISLLSKGTHQKDIPLYLQQNNIKPSGLSSVEKRLNLVKEVLGFSKNEQLIAYCKDYGII